MTALVGKPDWGVRIIDQEGAAREVFQRHLDEITQVLNDEVLGVALKLMSYTVSTVPSASSYTGFMIYVSDESGGAVPAFSDGTDWRRTTDRAIIS